MATPFPSSAAFGSSALLPPPLPTFPPPVTATAGSSASGSATTTTATSASGGAGVDGATLSAPVAGHKRKALRTCAGEVWEDPTLLEWPESKCGVFNATSCCSRRCLQVDAGRGGRRCLPCSVCINLLATDVCVMHACVCGQINSHVIPLACLQMTTAYSVVIWAMK